MTPDRIILAGVNNSGKPKQEYCDKLAAFSDDELSENCKRYIWLSAYADNNPRSDYHWMVDACYDEAKRRERMDIYEAAYKAASAQ